MNKIVAISSVALLASLAPVEAADIDQELGLIVSGVVDQWTGVQVVNNEGSGRDFSALASGAGGYLSLPLGTNLSIQNDFKIEYNSNAFDNDASEWGGRYTYQGAGHLSYRDPSSHLLGVFGGVGSVSHNDFWTPFGYDYRFVGGEAQFYINDVTLYGQGGYVDIKATDPLGDPDEALFGRGVVRWFLANDQRLQLEGTYVNVDNQAGSITSGYDVVAWGARYDRDFELPILGKTPFYVAYRGMKKSSCNMGEDQSDHTLMIGTSYSFSGSRIEIDRIGATLDTADFGNYFTCVNGVLF